MRDCDAENALQAKKYVTAVELPVVRMPESSAVGPDVLLREDKKQRARRKLEADSHDVYWLDNARSA